MYLYPIGFAELMRKFQFNILKQQLVAAQRLPSWDPLKNQMYFLITCRRQHNLNILLELYCCQGNISSIGLRCIPFDLNTKLRRPFKLTKINSAIVATTPVQPQDVDRDEEISIINCNKPTRGKDEVRQNFADSAAKFCR